MSKNKLEILYAEFLLCLYGFKKPFMYESLCNDYFLRDPNNKFLFELQELSSSNLDVLGRFERYWTCEANSFDIDEFAKKLFSELKDSYYKKTISIESFAKRCYRLWCALPSCIAQIEPFFQMCFIDDHFGWDDLDREEKEELASVKIEGLFRHYE